MAIWQVADCGATNPQVAQPLMRGRTPQLPQIQPFAILRVSNWRTLTDNAD